MTSSKTARAIERTNQFKKDFKRELKGRHGKTIESDLKKILVILIHDEPVTAKYKDHPLTGNLKDFRDCHLKPDLLLLYSKPNKQTLILVRLGSHSELFR